MVKFLNLFVGLFLLIELCPIFWNFIDLFVIDYTFFFFIFFIFFSYSYFSIEREILFNFNLDLLYKYYLLVFKTPNYFLNYVLNNFKKFFIYTIYFKYKFQIDALIMFIVFYTKKLLVIWRPLFKRFSYFGYYRANRSKWIK